MNTDHKTQWTSAEIGNYWNIYLANSMALCMFQHFLLHIEDPKIKDCLESADTLSKKILTQLDIQFKREGVILPIGFTKKDVNEQAPRLFSDSFYLAYLDMMVSLGMIYYTISLSSCSRMDIRLFLTDIMFSTMQLSNQVTQVMQEKGLHIRPPYIPFPKNHEMVKKQSFFNGYFGDKRSLHAIEIAHLFSNIQINAIKTILITGFSQVAKDTEIRNYFLRGKKINIKQHHLFTEVLNNEDLPAPVPSHFLITDSTDAPFSDSLMLFHISNLSSAKVRNYGDSIAVSPRHDLTTTYTRFLIETGNFAEDGGNIMIDHGWMESPPHHLDRDKLAKKNKKSGSSLVSDV